MMMSLSNFFYIRTGCVPVRKIILISSPVASARKALRRLISPFLLPLRVAARFWGLRRPVRPANPSHLRVLIAGGYGYGNVGDEAQLAANLKHWRATAPDCRITVLTPDEQYTERVHKVRTELAPRVIFFHANSKPHYGTSSRLFKLRFILLTPLLLLNARLIRAGLPVLGLTARQARLLDVVYNSDVLFLSGGGYLTGMTLSRLWDNMLLIHLADAFGVPVILSGQTIGVFKDRLTRMLARWGLKKAKLIYLRDQSESKQALVSIGIGGELIECTFDDALFFQAAPTKEVFRVLASSNIDTNRHYIVVNVHYWRQSSDVSQVVVKQLASALDFINSKLDIQIAFVAMHPADEAALKDVISLMQEPGVLINHDYDLGIAVGVIRNASLCLTMKHHPIIFAMGSGVPTVAIALEDYYFHKNEGALRIFGQDEFVVSCKPDDLYLPITENLVEAWSRSGEISKRIMARLEELRPRAGEVIYRWLKDIHSEK
jgi:polysaccharide pyruvyl transferase WcaK-like protein